MSRLVAQLLRTVVLVGAVWIGSVCLLGDRERGREAPEDSVHTVMQQDLKLSIS